VNYKSLNRFGTVLNVSLVENIVEPTTVKEALEIDLSDLWEEAMKKELESIYKHETWEVATPPRDAHPITTKWVFKERLTWAIYEVQSPSGGERFPAVGRERLQGDFQSSGQSRID
jgi:hypothetical protein